MMDLSCDCTCEGYSVQGPKVLSFWWVFPVDHCWPVEWSARAMFHERSRTVPVTLRGAGYTLCHGVRTAGLEKKTFSIRCHTVLHRRADMCAFSRMTPSAA
jgi:hypothetical protein